MGQAKKNFAITPLIAKPLAVREAIVLAANLGLSRVLLETNCLDLIMACRKEKVFWEIDGIVRDIHNLAHICSQLSFSGPVEKLIC
ncbi:hypothetical protein Patl1_13276 [Pistacia atlantica]|uniref:Uncharacterized protein n=1 Tax=Pistacia atlantica TaxID=434234 RepID=A0ACC1AU84_9ROSI|nr:hypothetical protein Patl1_13276 [Pistacia atlantica]